MRKLVLFMHLSLDGFAAGKKGEMDWIIVHKELFDYAATRTAESDTALYGRVTYELMESYWPTAADQPNPTKHDIEHSKWYKNVAKVVVSKTMKDVHIPNTTIIHDNLLSQIRRLKEAPGKEIIMFGSPSLAHTLTEANLIDDYWLFINPIILGEGISLFRNLKKPIKLRLLTSKTFPSGTICLHYNANSNQ